MNRLWKAEDPWSVKIDRELALVTPFRPPEQLVFAPGADVSGLLIKNPLLSPVFSPVGCGSQNDLLTEGNWKVFNEPARKIITLMTT